MQNPKTRYLFLDFHFYRLIGKSKKGFEKLSLRTAVLHARDMCFPGEGMHITRDMCFPGGGTHIPSDMCSLTWETHIPSDMCSPTWETHIPSDMHRQETHGGYFPLFLINYTTNHL